MRTKEAKPAQMMSPEIHWTSDDPREDLIPCIVKRTEISGDEVHIWFAGNRVGYQCEGVLKLKKRAGLQTVQGTQSYKEPGSEWESMPFTVVGQFDESERTAFSGTWTEQGLTLRFEVTGLPTRRTAPR